MPYDLFIWTSKGGGLIPSISDYAVIVEFRESRAGGSVDLEFAAGMSGIQIADVLRALLIFFEGEQFRSIDFDRGEMLVEKGDPEWLWPSRTEPITPSLVKAASGSLRDDGKVELEYPPPIGP